MTKELLLKTLYSLHDAAQEAFDEIPRTETLEDAVKREPQVRRAILFGRFIALGTAIMAVEQLDESAPAKE